MAWTGRRPRRLPGAWSSEAGSNERARPDKPSVLKLASGAQQLAKAKAIVRNLSDVETLGSTGQINTDKTGTLTRNHMTTRARYLQGHWYEVDGEGYSWVGQVRGVAGATPGNFDAVAYVSALANDATVSRTGEVVGDPTEAALLVKGGPDVILARCSTALGADGEAVPLGSVRERIHAANARLGGSGLRVLALAYRALPLEEADTVAADPMGAVRHLVFVGLVGIIDPLRPEAIEAVRVAHAAGIDVRMITGDHPATVRAIGSEPGLGSGGLSGQDFAAADDATLLDELPNLHVFGRVSPQDKRRLLQLQQEQGHVVAMTGDAVNDAGARGGARSRDLRPDHRRHRLPTHAAVRPGQHVPPRDRAQHQLGRRAAATAGAVPHLHARGDPGAHQHAGPDRPGGDAGASP